MLKKIRKRAHRLDEGMSLCGFRVGYTFFIGELVMHAGSCSRADVPGIVPGLGDAVNATLNYFMIVRPTKKLDVPRDLVAKMLANNAVSFGLG